MAAIEAQITPSANPDIGFVVFEDVSDKAKDGISRVVQLAGGASHRAATRWTPPHATAHQHALLTEQLFLHVLKAAPDYKLTYYNQVQQKPTPLPVGT